MRRIKYVTIGLCDVRGWSTDRRKQKIRTKLWPTTRKDMRPATSRTTNMSVNSLLCGVERVLSYFLFFFITT